MPDLSLIDRPESRTDLIASLPKGLRMAELGVFAGHFAAQLWAIAQPSQLHLIDLWAGLIECGDEHGEHVVKAHGDDLYAEVCRAFARHPEVRIYREPTAVIQNFGPVLDFVYVDADHAYQSVLNDLRWAATALRPGGWLAGHDYTWRFPGVIRAVDQFCDEAGWRISALTQDGCPSYLLVRA